MLRTTEEGQNGHSAVDSQRLNIFVPVGLSHEIDHDICTMTIGDLLHFFRKVLGLIVNRMRCT